MAGQLVAAGGAFIAGLKSEALGTYRRMYDGRKELLSQMMKLDIPSDKRTERYFFYNSAPHIVAHRRNEALRHKAFGGIRFEVENFEYARAINWRRIDREDDLSKGLVERARDLGQSIGLLDERIAFQILGNATDADLLASIPNAPDGRALFHANDVGSGNRFGVSGGNKVGDGTTAGSAQGLTTTAQVKADYYATRRRFVDMQDTEGQPLHNPSVADGSAVLVYPSTYTQIVHETFLRERVVEGSSTPTNVIQEAGLAPTLWTTQRLTATDWYVFLSSSEHRALFSQSREGIRTVMSDASVSDHARETGVEGIQFEVRKGYGIFTPYTACMVDNSAGGW